MKKISYFLSHPIQYQSPLLVEIENQKICDFEVVYFHDNRGILDTQFGRNVTWDLPLLEGYKYVFLKNNSKNPGVSGRFWGLINWSLISYLKKRKPDSIVIHGWGYFSNLLLLFVCKIKNIEVIMRAESPHKQELGKSKLNNFLKKIIIKIFSDKFLFLGESNKAFYLSLGVKEQQLFYAPYCVDNNRLQNESVKFDKELDDIRISYGIPINHRIVFFCGKFIEKKRPLDILKASNLLKELNNFSVVLVGTGNLEDELKKFLKLNKLLNIYFAGFVNQTELYKYYKSADVFILPSGYGETWGLVVNEAMNFSLPLVISDEVGCTDDLVHLGSNGFTYPCGDIEEFAKVLKEILGKSDDELKEMGRKSFDIVQNYSYQEIINGFKMAIK